MPTCLAVVIYECQQGGTCWNLFKISNPEFFGGAKNAWNWSFDLKRTYSKDALPGRTTQGFGVFCCLLTVLRALLRAYIGCAEQ